MTHAQRHRVVALETLPSNLPNVQLCCAYSVDNQSSSCKNIISHFRERKAYQRFLHFLSCYIVVLVVRHANSRRVVALETLPSNLPNVQLCCVYFVDNQSSSCEITISQLKERKTCQQLLDAPAFLIHSWSRSKIELSSVSQERGESTWRL